MSLINYNSRAKAKILKSCSALQADLTHCMPAAETLEQCAGPEARKLFEKFTRDLQKLQAQ